MRALITFCIAGQLLLVLGTQISLPGSDVALRAVFSHLILAAAAWLCLLRRDRVWTAVAIGITSWNVGMFVYDVLIALRGEVGRASCRERV